MLRISVLCLPFFISIITLLSCRADQTTKSSTANSTVNKSNFSIENFIDKLTEEFPATAPGVDCDKSYTKIYPWPNNAKTGLFGFLNQFPLTAEISAKTKINILLVDFIEEASDATGSSCIHNNEGYIMVNNYIFSQRKNFNSIETSTVVHPSYFKSENNDQLIGTLIHEMAHLYDFIVLNNRDDNSNTAPQFRKTFSTAASWPTMNNAITETQKSLATIIGEVFDACEDFYNSAPLSPNPTVSAYASNNSQAAYLFSPEASKSPLKTFGKIFGYPMNHNLKNNTPKLPSINKASNLTSTLISPVEELANWYISMGSESNYLTFYAASHQYEDFADTIIVWYMGKKYNLSKKDTIIKNGVVLTEYSPYQQLQNSKSHQARVCPLIEKIFSEKCL